MSTLTADDNMSELDTSNRGKMPPDGLLAVAAYDDDHALCVLGEFEGMNDEDDDAPSQHGGDETGVELHGRREGIRIPQLGGGGRPKGSTESHSREVRARINLVKVMSAAKDLKAVSDDIRREGSSRR